MEKLANKIADDVVARILLQIAENKKEEKIHFSIVLYVASVYDVGNYF